MLAERPRFPRELTKATRNHQTIYFVPDEVTSFGIWKSYDDAHAALSTWLRQFQGKPPAQWRSYCSARGWKSVEWP
jgi:hypothetical protein